MKHKKILGLLLASVLLLPSLAGCGSQSGSKTTDATNESVTANTTTEEENVTLTYGVRGADAQVLFDTVFEEFTKEHPNINVETQVIVDGDLPILAAGNELPDVFIMDTVLEEAKDDWTSYFLNLDDLKEQFPSSKYYFTDDTIGKDGSFYGMPVAVSYTGIYYNKEVFKAAGITELPKTIDEFYAICQKIVDNTDAVPMALAYKDSWPLSAWNEAYPQSLAGTENTFNMPSTLNTWFSEEQCFKKSGDFIRTLIEKGYSDEEIVSVGWDAVDGGFPVGKYAMVATGSWFHGSRISTGMLDEATVGYMPLPGIKSAFIGADLAMAISANTEYPEEAKELFLWLLRDGHYYEAEPSASIIKGANTDPVLIEYIENAKKMNIEIKEIMPDDDNDRAMREKINKSQMSMATVFEEYIISEDPNATMEKLDAEWNQ